MNEEETKERAERAAKEMVIEMNRAANRVKSLKDLKNEEEVNWVMSLAILSILGGTISDEEVPRGKREAVFESLIQYLNAILDDREKRGKEND